MPMRSRPEPVSANGRYASTAFANSPRTSASIASRSFDTHLGRAAARKPFVSNESLLPVSRLPRLMADVIALVVRFFHIAFAIAWIGGVMYGVGVLRRVLPRVDVPARKATMKQLIPVVTRYLPGSAAMTILTGAILYLYLGGFDPNQLVGSAWGLVLLTALVLALAAFAFGLVVGVGSAKRVLTHLEEPACDHADEVGALTKRFNQAQ